MGTVTADQPAEAKASRRWLTLPNAIGALRILAAPALVLLALSGRRVEAAVLFALMAVSDWLDGKLAVLLDQRSAIGPALDSVADLAMYGALAAAMIVLEPEALAGDWPWLAVAIAAYVVAGLWSLARFERWAFHHTRTAKVAWLLALVGGVLLVLRGLVWPLKVAVLGATLASVQSVAITSILPEWRADVGSISAAKRVREEDETPRSLETTTRDE